MKQKSYIIHKFREKIFNLNFFFLLFICSFSLSNIAYTQEDYDTKQTALALNYALVSLCKITSYNDIIILDQEYKNIINNIDLSKIEDEEVKNLYLTLMDTITASNIAESSKERLNKIYEQQLTDTLYSSFNPSSAALIFISPHLAITQVGSLYFNYQDNKKNYNIFKEDQEAKINEQMLLTLNDQRKDFLNASWELIRRYEFPDIWRLTEEQIFDYIDILKDDQKDRKYRKLLRKTDEFQAYPPFWYYLGKTSQDIGKNDEALKYYQKFSEIQKGIFRKDPFHISVNMNTISLLNPKENKDQILQRLEYIVDNSKDSDWNNILYAALQYINFKQFEKAKKLLYRNIDYEHSISLHKRILGEILINKESKDELIGLIENMREDNAVKNQDILYLFGKANDQLILDSIKDEIFGIQLSNESNLLGIDDLIVSVPPKWAHSVKGFQLAIENQQFTKAEHNSETGKVDFYFNKVFDKSEFFDADKNRIFEVHITHPSSTMYISFEAEIEKLQKKKNQAITWLKKKIDSETSDTYEDKKVRFTKTTIKFNDKIFKFDNNKLIIN
jgi:tetratricopeptide (TPR) repeat protein